MKLTMRIIGIFGILLLTSCFVSAACAYPIPCYESSLITVERTLVAEDDTCIIPGTYLELWGNKEKTQPVDIDWAISRVNKTFPYTDAYGDTWQITIKGDLTIDDSKFLGSGVMVYFDKPLPAGQMNGFAKWVEDISFQAIDRTTGHLYNFTLPLKMEIVVNEKMIDDFNVPLTNKVSDGYWWSEYYDFTIQGVSYSVQLVGPYWADGDINIWYTPEDPNRQGENNMSQNTVFFHVCDAAEYNQNNGWERGITQPVNASAALHVSNPTQIWRDTLCQYDMMLNYACSQELRGGDKELDPYRISGPRHPIMVGSKQTIKISCWVWKGTNADGSTFSETSNTLKQPGWDYGINNLKGSSVVVCPESIPVSLANRMSISA